MPEWFARSLLRRRWIIKPGLESSDPAAAVRRYVDTLSSFHRPIDGKCVLVFGYGGLFAVGVELLERGAEHVILCDHVQSLDHRRNSQLLSKYEKYLTFDHHIVQPRSQFMTLLHGDIRLPAIHHQIQKPDIILSTSVLEHLEDVGGVTQALAGITRTSGFHLHFIDLRDHYFKFPFEMLVYSGDIWRRFLNPSSNLNRLRLSEYESIFKKWFKKVEVIILDRNWEAFEKIQSRIRTEFKTGDPLIDSVTQIQLKAEEPRSLE